AQLPARPWSRRRSGLLVAVAHFDPPGGGLGPLRDHDLQHAIAPGGGNAVRIGAVGQREPAVEAAVAALHAREALLLLDHLVPALALDGQDALVHEHPDLARVDARQVGIDDEAVGLFLDVGLRRPGAGDDRGFVLSFLEPEKAVEDLPDFVLQDRICGPTALVAGHVSHVALLISGGARPPRPRCSGYKRAPGRFKAFSPAP